MIQFETVSRLTKILVPFCRPFAVSREKHQHPAS
jgi:hypothetical protein